MTDPKGDLAALVALVRKAQLETTCPADWQCTDCEHDHQNEPPWRVEVAAIELCVVALLKLDPASQIRVLNYLRLRFEPVG
jgi:hypothetical protein